MKIRWLSNGLYSLKNCHKQFGQAFRPPPFWAMPKFTRFFFGRGFPYIFHTSVAISQLKCLDSAVFVAKISKMTFTRFVGQVWLNSGQVRQFWGRGSFCR